MSIYYDPKQGVLFPDQHIDEDLPSIKTLPDFDLALENYIKLSDFGAFVQLNFKGIEKSYSLNTKELKIKNIFLKQDYSNNSPVFSLFPQDIVNHLNRIKYETRSFFNEQNSIKTQFGFFLFRRYFHRWYLHRKKVLQRVSEFLAIEIGEKQYQKYYTLNLARGINWLKSLLNKNAPFDINNFSFEDIHLFPEKMKPQATTIYQLDKKDPDFLSKALVIKTSHIPRTIKEYEKGIKIVSAFKTIHLDYLKGVRIDSVEDIENLFGSLDEELF